jgi:hypothetical protein
MATLTKSQRNKILSALNHVEQTKNLNEEGDTDKFYVYRCIEYLNNLLEEDLRQKNRMTR